MKKLSQIAAALAIGTACAMPVMAQDTSASSTASTTESSQSMPSTQTMGAAPEETARDDGPDMGWIGLLGLAGLLGLRRRHHHDDHMDHRRTSTVR